MTVELALRHAKPGDVVVVDPRAAGVGESSAHLQGGERLTVRELLEAALIQSANDAADALGYRLGQGSMPRFVAMMNAEARRLGLHDTHYARADGLDAPGNYSSARDVTRLARIVMRSPVVRSIVRRRTAELPRRPRAPHLERPARRLPGRDRRQDRPHLAPPAGRRSRRRAGAASRSTRPSSAARRAGSGTPTSSACSPGGSRSTAPSRSCASGTRTPGCRSATGSGRSRSSRAGGSSGSSATGTPLTEIVTAPEVASLPVERGAALGTVRFYEGDRLLGERPLVAARSVSKPGVAGRVRWYAARTFHHVAGFFS